jgi:hypothetical protein
MLHDFLTTIKRLLRCGLIVILLCGTEGFGQDETLFPKPSVRFKGDVESYTLPVKFKRDLIYVETYFGNQGPFNFVLDTGTSLSTMTPDLVSTLKLKSRNLHGDPRLAYVDVPLKYPGLEIEPQRFFSKLTKAVSSVKTEGILGYDFIRQFVLEIDYPHKVVMLYNRRSFLKPEPDDGRWEVVPFTWAKNCPQISVRLNYLGGASESLRGLIDTGANTPVLFTPEMVSRVGDRFIKNIQIGQGFEISPVACCPPVPIYPLNRPPFAYDLLLSGALFRGARLVFDYQDRKLYLRVR